ncbi:SgcJ/EcaC family oxidoreductase [Streptomyces antnestii]|uniref:SgcJ/EcaC family oxidoreductase n=1 Tax=Streptomyces antnestii TaxID=2494256 RepID=A0A437P9Q6_9ACTN|nr:SgcJ/EcaC family oxidoreductase [Streptomyces sp. San01]RVU18941.1 SgcJ/EcaC family oxidoreductase [Streptomyces sp. San01]
MTTTQDTAAITSVLSELTAAWGRHDAEAYGELFTQDATYVTFTGSLHQGRQEITDSHRALFTTFLKGTELADEVIGIRFQGADAAIVSGRGDTYKGERPRKLTKIQTYTFVREDDGKWRIAAFHNTKRKPLLEFISQRLSPKPEPVRNG